MALGRSSTRGPSPCPACDVALDRELSSADTPRCPACGVLLLPAQVAGFWQRAGAGAIDFGILLATAGSLNALLLILVDPEPLFTGSFGLGWALEVLSAQPRQWLGRIAPILVMSALYFVLFWTFAGRTPGQRLLGIRVVDSMGNPPGPARAGVRTAAFGLGFLPAALGILWAAFDFERRAFHDHVAGTFVVKEPRA